MLSFPFPRKRIRMELTLPPSDNRQELFEPWEHVDVQNTETKKTTVLKNVIMAFGSRMQGGRGRRLAKQDRHASYGGHDGSNNQRQHHQVLAILLGLPKMIVALNQKIELLANEHALVGSNQLESEDREVRLVVEIDLAVQKAKDALESVSTFGAIMEQRLNEVKTLQSSQQESVDMAMDTAANARATAISTAEATEQRLKEFKMLHVAQQKLINSSMDAAREAIKALNISTDERVRILQKQLDELTSQLELIKANSVSAFSQQLSPRQHDGSSRMVRFDADAIVDGQELTTESARFLKHQAKYAEQRQKRMLDKKESEMLATKGYVQEKLKMHNKSFKNISDDITDLVNQLEEHDGRLLASDERHNKRRGEVLTLRRTIEQSNKLIDKLANRVTQQEAENRSLKDEMKICRQLHVALAQKVEALQTERNLKASSPSPDRAALQPIPPTQHDGLPVEPNMPPVIDYENGYISWGNWCYDLHGVPSAYKKGTLAPCHWCKLKIVDRGLAEHCHLKAHQKIPVVIYQLPHSS
jgi:hypothetical protein